ncbi:MAG TPA: AAA family ATPase [Rugosimonospora sp.]|nr:AAA family ATPase [Rugosimonospora sp.]
MRSFGELLVGFRRAAGKTQEELAGATGLSVRAISDLERGRRSRPQLRTVEMLADALGLRGDDAALFLSSARTAAAGRPAGPVLFDRDEQLGTLRRLAEAVQAGHGSVVLVRGAAGLGKTALLNAWAGGQQAAGLRVLRATGAEAERGFAFAVVGQLVEPLVGETDAARLLAAGAQPGHEVLHGLYRLVVGACDDGPLALVVDDAQWADAPSARWLDYLARRIGGLPVLLVVATRPGDGAVEQLAGHLITLPALSPTAMTRWVRRECPDASGEFCGACAEAAGGDPSLLAELLRVVREEGIASTAEQAPRVAGLADRLLAEAAARRLSGQDEATRRLARALVVLGDGAGWPVVAALSGLSEAESRDRAERLRRIGVLAADGAARFGHPSIRAVLAETAMTAGERAAGHAGAAEVLYADGAPAEQVATHLLRAEPGTGGWRLAVLREAARVVRGRGLPEAAATYLRRALREPVHAAQRADLVLELGTDEVVCDPDAAARRLALALPGLVDPLIRGRVASLLADALFAAYRHSQAMEVLERAVTELGSLAGWDGLARELWWRLQAQLVLVGYECPTTLAGARAWAGRLRALGVAGDTPGERAVLLALATPAMMGDGDAATVNDLLDRGLRGELAVDARAGYPLGVAGLGFMLTDRLDDATMRYEQMRELAGRCGAATTAAQAVAGLSNVQWRRGERVPVTPPFDGALVSDLRARLSLVTVAVESLVERGEPDAAAEILARYTAAAATDESVRWAPVLVSAGRAQAERGDLRGGLALLLAYGAHEQQEGLGTPAATPWRSWAARICAALGEREQARRLATEEVEAAYRWGTPRVIGAGLRCLGSVAGGAEGRALLAEAVAVLEPSPARLEFAWATYEWGLAVRQAGDLRAGVGILGDALRLAELSGARLLAGRVRAELVAAGVRVDAVPTTT